MKESDESTPFLTALMNLDLTNPKTINEFKKKHAHLKRMQEIKDIIKDFKEKEDRIEKLENMLFDVVALTPQIQVGIKKGLLFPLGDGCYCTQIELSHLFTLWHEEKLEPLRNDVILKSIFKNANKTPYSNNSINQARKKYGR